MAIRYHKLFDMLNRRNMKKTDLLEIMSSPTLAKLGKGAPIKSTVINDICKFLNCQPGDIMEYIPDEPPKTAKQKLKEATAEPFKKGYKTVKNAPTAKEGMQDVLKEIKTEWTEATKKK